jgi:hypothetical protein
VHVPRDAREKTPAQAATAEGELALANAKLRDMLYTVVPPTAKYQSKNVIDTAL